jgi:hypothetical protein
VTDVRFGGSAGLLARLRPERVDVADLHDVAEALLPCLTLPGLSVELDSGPRRGTAVVLEEDERTLRVALADLADEMTDAGVRSTPTGISTALASWIAHRPVTDRAATAGGIAVVDWADSRRRAVGWRVVVRRGELVLPWQPSAACDASALHRIRSASLGRAHDVPLDLRVEGPVALWSHSTDPVLATAALVAPDRMLQRVGAAGLEMPGMYVVITPNRPVACADAGVARRLAGETAEACVIAPWQALVDLPWV